MKDFTGRKVFYYKDHYLKFFEGLNPDVQRKFNWTLQLISSLERVPVKYFKHISDSSGLYEIRVEVNSDIYRVFCFFDKGKLIILINGFKKKSEKIPRNEILLAERIKEQYYHEKEKK